MANDKEGKIIITRDGPYQVEGNVDINLSSIGSDANGDSVSWIKGREFDKSEEPMEAECTFLCRCGHSRTKPFCDGTHDDAGFCGHEHPDKGTYADRAEIQVGEAVDLMDDPSLCVGARFCDVGASAWSYAKHSGDPANLELAVKECGKCPSGRLTIVEKDGTRIEPKLDKGIGVVQDPINNCRGPLWVKGGIPIEDADGKQYETRNRVTLCRCGESQNQPYCDGSHYNCRHMEGMDK